jgi:hypothetical protein
MPDKVQVADLIIWIGEIRRQFGAVILGESFAHIADRKDVRNAATSLDKHVSIILNTTIHAHVVAAVSALCRLHDFDDEKLSNRICLPRLFRVLENRKLLEGFCKGQNAESNFEVATDCWEFAQKLESEYGADTASVDRQEKDRSIKTVIRKFRNRRIAHFLDMEPDPLYGADIWRLASSTGSIIDHLGKSSGSFSVSVRSDRKVWDDRVLAYFSHLLGTQFEEQDSG